MIFTWTILAARYEKAIPGGAFFRALLTFSWILDATLIFGSAWRLW